MAGEAVSRTSLTLAFQKRKDLEWRKLRQNLHHQLQQDISRIYTNSLYCDLELELNTTTIHAHRSILQTRATQFFNHLCKLSALHNGLQSITFSSSSVECITKLVRNIYTKCSIHDDEIAAIRCLDKSTKIERLNSVDSVLSPESDIYLTPNCSPSDIFPKAKVRSGDRHLLFQDETQDTINIHQTNRSYYSIVPVEEVFNVSESSLKPSESDVLEKELAEQDELLKSFHSIKSKEEKKTVVSKLKKPTSLPFTSSHYTKKQKRGCDINEVERLNKQDKYNSDLFQFPYVLDVETNEQIRTNLKKENIINGIEYGSNSIKEKEFLKIHKYTKLNANISTYTEVNQNKIDEDFMCSPIEIGDCVLECCTKNSEDFLNFPCSPEMDASGAGPDSGVDTSSTGCLPGGGLSSPREHTVSETSGVDLTDDIPHDGEERSNVPAKLSASSSVSSEVGTWDNSFQPINANTEQIDVSAEDTFECSPVGIITQDKKSSVNSSDNLPAHEPVFATSLPNIQSEHTNALCQENSTENVQCGGEPADSENQILFDITFNENESLTSGFFNIEESVKSDCFDTINISNEWAENKSNVNLPEPNFITNYPESVAEGQCSEWKIESTPLSSLGSNNFFIDASSLVDDSELILPPFQVTTSLSKETTENSTLEFESSKFGEDIPATPHSSPCHENINTEDTSKQSISSSSEDSSQTTSHEEKYLNMDISHDTGTSPEIELHSKIDDPIVLYDSHLQDIPQKVSNFIEIEQNLHVNDLVKSKKSYSQQSTPSHFKRDYKKPDSQDVRAEFEKEIVVKTSDSEEKHKTHADHKVNSSSVTQLSPTSKKLIAGDVFESRIDCCPLVSKESSRTPHNILELDQQMSDAQIHTTDVTNSFINCFDHPTNDSAKNKFVEANEKSDVSHVISVNNNNDDLKDSAKESNVANSEANESNVANSELQVSEEQRRPSLIRRNTFELDPDDDKLALLRQEYERRQGNLLFKNHIPQFSGHVTGSEGFRDTQSLIVVGSVSDTDGMLGHSGQTSLPNINMYDSFVLESSSMVSNMNQLLNSQMVKGVSSSYVSKSYLKSDEKQNVSKEQNVESYPVDQDRSNLNESNESTESSKKIPLLFDNATKPVVSGAITFSDLLDDKKSWESPKKQKRTESTPIVSGGVSSTDFSASVRKVNDSPIMTRRKNESAPILSGAAPYIPEANTEIIENRSVSNTTTKSAWVVDMSVSSRPPLDVKKRRKSDVFYPEPLENSHKKNEVKASGHGFFIPLQDAPDKEMLPHLEKSQLQMENKIQKSASASSVKTTGLGYFVDFDEAKSNKEKSEKKVFSNSSEIKILPTKPKVEDLKLSCGFFVDLKNECEKGQKSSVNLVRQHSADEAKTSSSDKKNTMFSMFIDIGSTKQELPPKLSTPQVSRRKLVQKVQEERSVPKADITQTSKTSSESSDSKQSNANGTYLYIDASEKLPPVKQCEVVHDNSDKKQAVFMFIETDSPVTRRKTLPSGLRPNFNRHSWNPDNRTSQVTEEQQVLLKQQHKRAHSLSVDRSSISSVNKKFENEPVIIQSDEPEGNNLQSKKCPSQSSEVLTMQHMPQSYHSNLSADTSDKFEKHSLSLENKVISDTGFIPDLNTDKHSSIHHNQKYDGVACDNTDSKTSSVIPLNEIKNLGLDLGHPFVGERKTNKNKESEVIRSESKINPKKCLPNGAGDCFDKKTSKFPVENVKEIQRKSRVLENNDASSCSVETKVETFVETKVKLNPSSGNESFVKLSDLDKEPDKSLTQSVGSNDALPSFATTNRMTRSIPETSWIENKLLMTRSIGSGTGSKSLSRLFPHLHTVTSTSPSSLVHSKSTSSGQLEGDEENQVSETSDLSSMQSSMGRSGLEGSTEETDASSSYAGRSGPVSRLGEDLLRMFLEEINPDVTVEVGGRRLKAHKCILASRCQYFAAILSGGWVESAGNVISLQGFSYNAVHFALCHIYSGTSNIPDSISIVELATLADMLGLEGLKEVIMYTLKVKYCHFFHKPCSMCAVGVLECLPLAAAYGLDEIYRKSLRWITKHFVRIWPTKSFASLPRELVEKCYQQHVVHMTTENVLETIMSCDKLLATLPNVRWAEPIFSLTSQLLDASIKYMSHNFCGVLASDNFQSLGKELSWNISRLEDSLLTAADRLPPDQACLSYTYLNKAPDQQWSPNFIELLVRLQKRVELNLVRQAPRAARTASWNLMPLELRQRIQEAACLVLVPSDETHRSPHAALSRRSTSSSGSRNLDLRQVKLAMTQQARRAASGGRVSVLRADNSRVRQKPQAPNAEDIRKTSEAKSKSLKHKTNHSTSNVPTPEKAAVAPRRTPKTMISSSDSSRTSSPAMRRSAAISDNTTKSRISSTSTRGTTGTPPLGREVRSRKKKDGETAMSTDSLAECLPTHNNSKHPARETTDHVTNRIISSTRPDTPHLRRKVVDDGIMSTDSLSESATSTGLSFSAPNATRPETPKQRRHNILGRLGTDVTMSTDSLVPVDKSHSETNRLENSKYTPGKVLKTSSSKNESQQSPSSTKKSGNRQSVASPRESPTARLRSGLSPYTGSPSLRRNVLMSAKPSTDNPANNNVKQSTTTRAEKGLIKTNSSPSTSYPASRRTPTRVVTRGQVLTSPAKVHLESSKTTGNKNVGKSLMNTNKINNNAAKKISNGVSTSFRTVHPAVKHEQKKEESMDSKLLTVGSRSGTFLKDEPTVLKKPDVEDVCE